jgi:hypothetical protein
LALAEESVKGLAFLEKRMKTVSCGETARPHAATLRYPEIRRRQFTHLLLLLVSSISLCAAAQSTQPAKAPSDNQDTSQSGGNSATVIVIGFVGGFARHDDLKHPEVQFAESLREHYGSDVYAEVFGNHHGRKALHQVLRLLDTNRNGALSSAEKEQARIIIYGHSWGAAETVVFARALAERNIPVLLTIQMDSIRKPGRDDSTIPPNVAAAINFYQSGGPLHGRTQIVAADSAQTKIIGNLHMTYEDNPINCDNYPWYARTFNKPHHEIENDPRVWDHAASLIDSEVASATSTAPESASESPLKFDSIEQQDRCRVYNGSGYLLRDEVFLPANGGKPIPADQLRVVQGGDSHSVHLLNGTVLIPRDHFEGIKKELPENLSGGK